MYLLIPLGGLGTRFKNFGYSRPKPLIKVFGKEIIFWLLDNLDLSQLDEIFIPYNKELKNYNFEDLVKKRYPNTKFKFLCLETNTRGAAETILITLSSWVIKDSPILVMDGDNFYTTNIINKWNGQNGVFVFEDFSPEPIFSYIEHDNSDKIKSIIEKNKISNWACTGAYGFNSSFKLKQYCKYIIDNNIKIKDEFYTSLVIGEMIKNFNDFKSITIDTKNYICLGTPLQVRLFCNNYPKINSFTNQQMIEPRRICWDLDGTLVSFPVIPNDYTTVLPIQKNIDFLKYLKKFGNTIIIYTARKMKSCSSNIGMVNKHIGSITFDTLEKFDIPYDEIYFGKPYADYYIDDLAINVFDSLEKSLGYYIDTINPRDFNSVTKSSMEIIKKESITKLDGEIYFYSNIPYEIKDMFPIMFDYDSIEFKWYNLEFIDGIPMSKLFLSENLYETQFINIIKSIERIHSQPVNSSVSQINIYDNYTTKLVKRFDEYDYSRFDDYILTYNEILEKLYIYESKNLGKIGVIHGDTVFTNIIINKYEKIKFIDMRGKIGSELTIYGDIMYDWAKFYQSLIGYDEILDSKVLNSTFVDNFVKIFENYIIEKHSYEYLGYIKTITKSLLFSLIPLHANSNCEKFYNLIKKIH